MELTIDIGTHYDVVLAYIGQIQTLNRKVAQMENIVVEKDDHIEWIKQENDDLKDTVANIKNNAHLSDVANETKDRAHLAKLTLAENLLVDANDQVLRLDRENMMLKTNVKVLTDKLVDRDNELSENNTQNENLTKQINNFKDDLANYKNIVHCNTAENEILSQRIKNLNEELANSKKENLEFEVENKKLKLLNDKAIDGDTTLYIFALIILGMIGDRKFKLESYLNRFLDKYGEEEVSISLQETAKTRKSAFITSLKDLHDDGFFGNSCLNTSAFSSSSNEPIELSFRPFGLPVFNILTKLKMLNKCVSEND